jgi:hypothetical protein
LIRANSNLEEEEWLNDIPVIGKEFAEEMTLTRRFA